MQESYSEIKDRIKERADIVQIVGEVVDLKKSGPRYLGRCPFHGEKTPSFTVNSGGQFYHCFGCSEHGDVFDFMMKYHNLDFPSAVKELAGRYGIVMPEKRMTPEQEEREQLRKQMFAVNARAAELYRQTLLHAPSGRAGRGYLQERGISKEIGARFGLGYAPPIEAEGWGYLSAKLSAQERDVAVELGLLVKNDRGGTYDRFRDRVLFPIYDISGRVTGFGGRIIGQGQPKYMNSPESQVYTKSNLLLGLYQLKEVIRRKDQAIVVEGNFDLISLVAHGCENVVAPLGTALTREQLRLLKRYAREVVLFFDGDEAGVQAAMRSVPLFLAEQVSGRVALLPSGHDPDTFVREEGAAGVDALIEKAESLPEFLFSHLVATHGLTLDGKSRIVEELRPLAKAASSPLQRSIVVAHFAQQLGLSFDQLDSMLEKGEVVTVPEPGPSPRNLPRSVVKPLSLAQKQLVAFMVLNPSLFPRLEEEGIRHYLAGSTGEVIFLQIQELCGKREEFEPEEILAALPPGEEKELVTQLLLDAGNLGGALPGPEDREGEVRELMGWLKREELQKTARAILEKIDLAQRDGDLERVSELLLEKQQIEQKVRGIGD